MMNASANQSSHQDVAPSSASPQWGEMGDEALNERARKSLAQKQATTNGLEQISGFRESLRAPTQKWGRKDCSTIVVGHSVERDATVNRSEKLRHQLRIARRRRGKRGVALLMVLSTLAVLSVMLTEFQDATSAELGSSVAARDQVKAEYAARSAVNLTRLLFAAEPTVRKSLAILFMAMKMKPPQIPVWEYADVILGPFGDTQGNETFENFSGLDVEEGNKLGMDGAGFDLVVVDEDSKINFNLAARADTFSQQRMAEQILAMIGGLQYDELFDGLDERGQTHDRQTVCGAIIDWADPNTDRNACDPRAETATSAAAEDSYYQLLPQPYQRKNAAFDSLQEIRLVRGIDEKFWQTFVQSDPDDPRTRNVTVWGTGDLNVNTATPLSLLALACHKAEPGSPLCEEPAMQAQFISTLKMLKSFQQGIPIFSTKKDFINAVQGRGPVGTMMVGMGLTPVKLLSEEQVSKVISVKSEVFSIYATGYVKSGRRETRTRIHTVIDMRGAPPPGDAEAWAEREKAKEMGLFGPGLQDTAEGEAKNPYLLPSPGGSILYYRVD